MSSDSAKASVVLVGCGCPLRSMGWYHAVQLIDNRCPSAALRHVVEPFYMSEAGMAAPGNEEFNGFRAEQEARGVLFYATVEEVPAPASGEKRMAIISARTADNPRLFSQCLGIGANTIFLEKPGAPSVADLESMRDLANAAGVRAVVGFNKNVSSFCTKARALGRETSGSQVTFLSNNSVADNEAALGECFERNAEGMLKNMAIHELAIMVTFYDVTVDNIQSVVADKEFSHCKTLKGPSGKEFTDFSKLKFKVTTKSGKEVTVAADRCGGDDSVGIVSDAEGQEIARYIMPDMETAANIVELNKKYAGAVPYFFTQDPDYALMKERVARCCIDGTPAEGVPSLDVAVDALKLAEYLLPLLQSQLLE